jgi:uncharacterized membrane protein YfcA
MANQPVKVAVNRTMVGLISLVCLSSWLFLYFRNSNAEGDLLLWQGGLMRAGLLMGAFWIALPTKNRDAAWANVSPWTLAGMIGGVIGIAARPRVFVPLLAILAVVSFFLRPRGKARDQRPDREWDGR